MDDFLTRALGVHAQALDARSRRAEVLANNLANIDTPQYKARDLDFEAALANASKSQGSLKTTDARHLQPGDQAGGASAPGQAEGVKYRVPLHSSPDGNTVNADVEKAQFTENAMRYQASLVFLTRKFAGLKAALGDQ